MKIPLLNNRYQITSLLGRGAMGRVYRALDYQSHQDVALKVIAEELILDEDMLKRFRREGEALRQLRHRNIVAWVDMFDFRGHPIIVMEYMPGGSLRRLVDHGPLSLAQVREVALDLCDALISAHRLNIIHRDLKPENVMMAADGTPKLCDFGLARLMESRTKLTSSGMIVGTPHYMAPEAWEGQSLDAQADIWSLGVTLFELVTGRLPFGGDTTPAVMKQVLTAPVPDLRTWRSDVPEAWTRIIERALARDLAQRYPTVRMMSLDIEQSIQLSRAPRELELAPAGEGVPPAGLPPPAFEDAPTAPLPPPGIVPPASPPAEEPVSAPPPSPRAAVEPPPPSAPPPKARWNEAWLLALAALALVCLGVAGILAWRAGLFRSMAPAALPTAFVAVTTAPPAQSTQAPTQVIWPTPYPATPPPGTHTPAPTVSLTSAPPAPAPSPTPSPTAPTAPAQTPAPGPTLGIGSTMVSDLDGMELLYVPAGPFLMGSTDAEIQQAASGCGDCLKQERPQHTVSLDAYWIDKTDVTNAMFAKFVQATHHQTDAERHGGMVFDPATNQAQMNVPGVNWQHPNGPGGTLDGLDNYPVVQVSWADANAYCMWAGRNLPTEAQWEKAARGTDGRWYPWGNGPAAGSLLNLADVNLPVNTADKNINDGYEFASPVGAYPAGAGPYGALDMAGNVFQWVADWYSDTFYSLSPGQNPLGPATGKARGLRGGSWANTARLARAANRSQGMSTLWGSNIGFRCVR